YQLALYSFRTRAGECEIALGVPDTICVALYPDLDVRIGFEDLGDVIQLLGGIGAHRSRASIERQPVKTEARVAGHAAVDRAQQLGFGTVSGYIEIHGVRQSTSHIVADTRAFIHHTTGFSVVHNYRFYSRPAGMMPKPEAAQRQGCKRQRSKPSGR